MAESLEIHIRAIDNASRAIQSIQNSMQGLQQSGRNVGRNLAVAGAGISAAVTAPVVLGLNSIVRAAIESESALADVNKALNLSAGSKEAAATAQEINRLAIDLGQMPTAITAAYAEAGRLGVQRSQIQDYTRLINEAGVAWGMTTDKAASEISTLSNVMGLLGSGGMVNMQGLQELGDMINHVADSSATNEPAIASVLQRFGGAARTFGLTNREAVSLSGAFLDLGYPPEVVGTALNSMLPKLQNASQQTGKFQDALEQIGLPAKQFEQLVKEDAVGAINTLMASIQKSGDTSIISRLFGDGSDSAMLNTALQSMDRFNSIMQMSDADVGGGMTKTFEAQMQTTEAQMNKLNAMMQVTKASLGAAILPAINDIVKGLQPMVQGFAEFAQQNPGIVRIGVSLGVVAAIIGPLLIGAGFLISAFTTLAPIFGIIKAAILGALGFVGFPVLLAVAALAAAAFLIIKNWGPIKTFFAGLWEGIKAGAASVGMWIAQQWTNAVNWVKTAWSGITTWFSTLWNSIVTSATSLGARISAAFQSVVTTIQGAWSGLTAFFSNIWNSIVTGIQNAVNGMVSAIQNGASQALGAIQNMGASIVNAVTSLGQEMYAAGVSIVQSIADGIRSAIGSVTDAISSVTSAVAGFLPGSPVQFGDLQSINRGHAGMEIMKMISVGMDAGSVLLSNSMGRATSTAAPGIVQAYAASPTASGATASGPVSIQVSMTNNFTDGNSREQGEAIQNLERKVKEMLPRLLKAEQRRVERVSYS